MAKLQLTTFRLILIILNYYNYVTDILMVIKYWNEDYMVYFWITVSTTAISWLLCALLLIASCRNKLPMLFLIIAHLDYPVLLCLKEDSMKKAVGFRKYVSTGIQASAALLISVHYLFISQQASLLTLLSIAGSIVDISYTVILYNLFEDDISQVNMLSITSILKIVPLVFMVTCQNLFMAITFGFITVLYWPYGAYVFVGFAILILAIALQFTGMFILVGIIVGAPSALFAELNFAKSKVSVYQLQKLIQFLASVIAIAVHHDQFSAFIASAEIWRIMAYVACGSFVIWLIINLCCCFREVKDLNESICDYLNEEETKGLEFDLSFLKFED